MVQVLEPSEEKAILMMRATASVMEQHHSRASLDEALEAAVKLSRRYIPDRQLPDKAISLLDTACARVAISQHAVPAEVDDCRKRISGLETELQIIEREQCIGIDAAEREAAATASLEGERQRLQQIEERWEAEKELVEKILDIRKRLRDVMDKAHEPKAEPDAAPETTPEVADATVAQVPAEAPVATTETKPEAGAEATPEEAPAGGDGQDPQQLGEELQTLQARLRELQGESPLILPTADAQAVASVVADWTGIPVGRMVKNEIETVLHLADILNRRIIGQRHALEMISKRI